MSRIITNKKRFQCVSYRSVWLLILWYALMYAQINLLQYFAATTYIDSHVDGENGHSIFFDIGYCLIFFLFFFFGLLADVRFGRYKTLITGVHLCFLSWILLGFAAIVKSYTDFKVPFMILYVAGYIVEMIGYSSFVSNIIQFSIDQILSASTDKFSAIIYWDSVSIHIVYTIIEIGQCSIKQFVIVSYVVSGIAVTAVIVSNCLCKHWLDTTPHIMNSMKLMANVITYAIKNKYPKNRSALTYWEEDYPSRLDLGKEKYGGPFTEEQVENVKTLQRLTPLLICIVGYSCGHGIRYNSFSSLNQQPQLLPCFVYNNSIHSMVAIFLILFYLLIIHRFFNKYIPSMLKRIALGLVFILLTPLYYVIMFASKEHFQLNTTSYHAILVPQILSGITFALIFPTSLEFTIAQSPNELRGFMIGLWYAAFGLGYVISINGKYPFDCTKDIICQNIYYFIFKTAVIAIILIVFMILAKRYKLRVRENEVNIHIIAEEHYERYFKQEVEYEKEIELLTD